MSIWKFIQEELSKDNRVVLITVVERNGSSPGIVGFKMAVSETGAMTGSVGGGSMEYKMVDLAKETAKNNNKKAFIKKQIHNPDAGNDSSGLICAGEQSHAFILLDKSFLNDISTINLMLDKGENGALLLNQDGFFFDSNKTLPDTIHFQFNDENHWKYSEQIGLKPSLYIFGAGHVSLPLSQIFRVLDFNVIVYDNRDELSTFENNHFAHKKEIVDFNNVSGLVPEGENSYAVIMTVGHSSDELILEQLAPKNLKYLGMIGSKSKVKKIYDSLVSKGTSESDLAKVDAPIGLSIHSKTTAEIAISIAAKIVQVKNSNK